MNKTLLQKDFRAYTKDVLGEVAMKCLSISELESLCIGFILQRNLPSVDTEKPNNDEPIRPFSIFHTDLRVKYAVIDRINRYIEHNRKNKNWSINCYEDIYKQLNDCRNILEFEKESTALENLDKVLDYIHMKIDRVTIAVKDDEIETAALNYRDKSDDENLNEETMQVNIHWYDKQEAFTAGVKWLMQKLNMSCKN